MKGWVSETTGEVVFSVFAIIPRLIERDWQGRYFLNLVWTRE